MPTHPFAIKCAEVLEHAKRLLAAAKRAKKSAKDAATPGFDGPEFVPYAVTRWVPGSGSMETQGNATPGEGLFSADKREALAKDPALRALNEQYARALEECARRRSEAAATGSQTLEDGTVVRAPRKSVSMPCPKATALAKQIDAYIGRQYGNIGARRKGSGGGGW